MDLSADCRLQYPPLPAHCSFKYWPICCHSDLSFSIPSDDNGVLRHFILSHDCSRSVNTTVYDWMNGNGELMDEWMGIGLQIPLWMNEWKWWTNGWMDGHRSVNTTVYEWTNEWMNEWMDGWMDGCSIIWFNVRFVGRWMDS